MFATGTVHVECVLVMRFSPIRIGPMLLVLLVGCVAGETPTEKSTPQAPSERPGSELILPPPLESATAEEGPGAETYDYGRRLEGLAARRASVMQTKSDPYGVLTAIAYREVADEISVVVDLYDNSDLNRLILDSMVRALLHAQHEVGGRPQFELSFSSEFHIPVYHKRDPDMGEISFGSSLVPHRLEMNVWSSSHDSLITGRRSRSRKTGQYDFEIRAWLRDQSLGRVIWEGSAVAYVEREGAAGAVPSMVDALVGGLGRTVRGDRFPLQ